MKDDNSTKCDELNKIKNISSAIMEEKSIIGDLTMIIDDICYSMYGNAKKCEKEEKECIDSIDEIGYLEYYRKNIVDNCNSLLDLKNTLINIFKDIKTN